MPGWRWQILPYTASLLDKGSIYEEHSMYSLSLAISRISIVVGCTKNVVQEPDLNVDIQARQVTAEEELMSSIICIMYMYSIDFLIEKIIIIITQIYILLYYIIFRVLKKKCFSQKKKLCQFWTTKQFRDVEQPHCH